MSYILADDTVRDAEENIWKERELILEMEIHQAKECLLDWVSALDWATEISCTHWQLWNDLSAIRAKNLGITMNKPMKLFAQCVSLSKSKKEH